MPPTNEAFNVHHAVSLFIDEVKYELAQGSNVSGSQLRALVPVPADRDLWFEVPGPKDDVLIKADVMYEVKPGSHYYTAPSTINPGGQ